MTLKNRVDDHCDSSSAEQWEIAYAKLKERIKFHVTSFAKWSRRPLVNKFSWGQCDHFSDLLELLQYQDKSGWTLGHEIAGYHDSEATKEYLDLLSSMQLTPGQLYQLLALQTKDNWTLGHVIVGCQKAPAATKKYLNLLSSMQLTPGQLYQLLALQTNDNWTLGHMIAGYQKDPAATKHYLDLLSSMQLTPDQLYQLLTLQNKDNCTLGHVIARSQGPAATKQYLDLLSSKQLTPDQLYPLLTMQTNFDSPLGHIIKGNWTLGHKIARYQDPAATKQYLDLYQFYQLLNKDNWTLGHMIEKYQPKEEKKLYIATMGRLISHAVSDKNLPLLSPDVHRYFSRYKEAILNHLLTLEEGEKLIALNNALDKEHPLGQIFWHQRGWVAPNLNSGSLKIIAAEVKKIRPQTNKLQCKQVENKVTMSTAAPQQKTTEQITEADIPYTGNYPNLYRLLNSSKAQSTQPAIHSKVVQIMRPDYTELTPNPYLKQIITDQYGVLYLSVSPSAVSKVNDKAQEKTYPLQTEKRQFTSALFKQPNSVEDTARNEEEKQRIVATLTLLENAPAAPTNELILSSSTEENPPQIRHEKKAVLL